ncbi:MAG: AcrR family transcriptional regulator [Zhongshania sp.]|jgi:AcrR family transcriptional regulator
MAVVQPVPRKTQSQRRQETQKLVLNRATRLFADKGFSATSLEDIAADMGLTIRPIYHYFGNKIQLFEAVAESQESILLEDLLALNPDSPKILYEAWDCFVDCCKLPGFVQIVLVDSPHVLGRERMANTAVVKQIRTMLVLSKSWREYLSAPSALDQEFAARMLLGALTEAALLVGANPNYDSSAMIKRVFSFFD